MKKRILFLLTVTVLAFSACTDEEPELGEAPTAADAAFTYTESTSTPNILEFQAVRSDVVAVWDFGNGSGAEGSSVVGIYPNAGIYAVTLTVFTKGGSFKRTDSVIIAADDPTLLNDPLFRFLTGGADSLNGRTWAVDSANAGHFGVGPVPSHPDFDGYYPKWYAATANEKAGAGIYDDRYVFTLSGYRFDMITKGQVFIDDAQGASFPGAIDLSPDKIAPLPDQLGENWTILKGQDTTLTLTGRSFLGHYTGTREYRILTLNENELFVAFTDDSNADLMWYIRLIPEGYNSRGGGGSGGSTGTSLPIDFEGADPGFVSFNGSTATVESNPQPTGSNTSANVLETVKGGSNDAGVYVDLDARLDFSTNTKIAFKLFNPNPFNSGVFRVKLEDQSDPQNNTEVDVNFIGTASWITYEADFAGAASGLYDRIVLFPGWATTGTDTYHIDDIEQK